MQDIRCVTSVGVTTTDQELLPWLLPETQRPLQLGQNCMQLVGRGGWLHSGEAPITLPVPPPKKSGQQSTIPAVVTVGKQA